MVGAQLPPGEDGKPFTIKLGKLRGVESQGLLCSARELKISQDSEGLMELPSGVLGVALGTILLTIFYGRFTWKVLFDALRTTLTINAMIMMIVLGVVAVGTVHMRFGDSGFVVV